MEFRHKNIRLNASQYRGQRSYSVTICTAQRKRIFAVPQHAEQAIAQLLRAARIHSMAVYAYCVMPDHVHILVQGAGAASDLLEFVKEFKQRVECGLRWVRGRELWQKKFYDRILRPRDSLDRIAAYIWMNPVRKGLCRAATEYRYSGSCVVDWEEIAQVTEPWVPEWKNGES